MFDIGWLELIVIGVVALIVVGPEDLPGMFRTVGRFMGRMRGMAREFQRSMEEAADQSGLKDATKGLNDIGNIARGPSKSARAYAKDLVMSDSDKAKRDAEKAKRDADDEVEYAAQRDKVPPRPAPDTAGTDAAPAPGPSPSSPTSPSSDPAPAAADDRRET